MALIKSFLNADIEKRRQEHKTHRRIITLAFAIAAPAAAGCAFPPLAYFWAGIVGVVGGGLIWFTGADWIVIPLWPVAYAVTVGILWMAVLLITRKSTYRYI